MWITHDPRTSQEQEGQYYLTFWHTVFSPMRGAEQRFVLVQQQQTSILHAHFTAVSYTLRSCTINWKERQSLSTTLNIQASLCV